MFECNCGRKFKRQCDMLFHRQFCGKIFDYNGYDVFIGDDGREVFVHRFIMEQILERKLEKWEDVHHKDGNKKNNHPDNLEVLSKSEHTKLHWEKLTIEERKCRSRKTRYVRRKPPIGKKLTAEKVLSIREQLKQLTPSTIAEKYGVNIRTITEIRDRRTWKHI